MSCEDVTEIQSFFNIIIHQCLPVSLDMIHLSNDCCCFVHMVLDSLVALELYFEAHAILLHLHVMIQVSASCLTG
jgi:hypothetical protein